MPTWILRAVLPDGYTFNGEMVYPITDFEIPYSFKNQIDRVEFKEAPRFNLKINGFEYVQHQIESIETETIISKLSIQTIGSMPLWICDRLRIFSCGCNGSGMFLEFYDDWITNFIYTGRWINAGDIKENSDINGTVKIDLNCWKKEAIVS
jgi:hypothetical protein